MELIVFPESIQELLKEISQLHPKHITNQYCPEEAVFGLMDSARKIIKDFDELEAIDKLNYIFRSLGGDARSCGGEYMVLLTKSLLDNTWKENKWVIKLLVKQGLIFLDKRELRALIELNKK